MTYQGRAFFIGALALLGILGRPETARAQTRFTLSSVDLGPQSNIDQQISSDASSDYLRRLANAVTFIQAGSSSDYSIPFKHLILSMGVGLGYSQGYAGFGDVIAGRAPIDSLGAFSAQGALSLGLHFKEEDRSRFFFSFASSNYTKDSFHLENWGWGALWQYDLLRAPRAPWPLLTWSGLRFGTGFRWNHMQSHFAKNLGPLSGQVNVPGEGTYTGTVAANLDLGSDVQVMSVPFELGSAIKFASAITLYGTAAADLNFGDAHGALLVTGPVSVQTPSSNGGTQNVNAQATYSVSKSEDPNRWSLRGIAGLQVELGRGSVFVQYQCSSLENSEAAAVGFRAYF